MFPGGIFLYLEITMAAVTDERIAEVAIKLYRDMYETAFRGKERGRFCLTRRQLKEALQTDRLHPSTIMRLQDEAMRIGLIIIDDDDLFPCIERRVARHYRRPPRDVFRTIFPAEDDTATANGNEEDDD
jgi:hypothetical protein